MSKTIRQLKSYAKETLRGSYTTPILAILAVAAVNLLGSRLAGILFRDSSVFTIVICQIFLFVLSLIMGIFSAGLSYMFLNMARGKAFSVGDLLYLFKNHPDRVIVAGFVLGLIDMVVSIPYYYVNYFVDPGTSADSQMEWMILSLELLLLSLVLNLLVTLPFAVTYFLLADDLELGGLEALKKSAHMMKGKMGRYLLLQISFVPLMFLSVFTLYIAMLWILPYMQMSTVMFYRDLCGEFAPEIPKEDTPYSLSQKVRDDFNSEA